MDLQTSANGGAAASSVLPADQEGKWLNGRNVAILLIVLVVSLGLGYLIVRALSKRADAKAKALKVEAPKADKVEAPVAATVVVPAAAVSEPVKADVKPAPAPVAKTG